MTNVLYGVLKGALGTGNTCPKGDVMTKLNEGMRYASVIISHLSLGLYSKHNI